MDDKLYQQLEGELKTITGQNVEITPLGSLGLMALGDIGVMLWKAKRTQVAKEMLQGENVNRNFYEEE